MKNAIVKRILMAALTGTLCLGAVVTANAAPEGDRRGDRQMEQEQSSDSERPEPPEAATGGERPGLPEGVEEGDRPELPEGIEEGDRPELPEGVEKGDRPGLPEGAVNIMAYKDALSKIEDEDTKSSLQVYIDALEKALSDEKAALDKNDELTEDEIAACKEAVKSAEEALTAAFKDAEIDVDENESMPAMEESKRDKKLTEDTENVAENPEESTTPSARIINWIKGLFK